MRPRANLAAIIVVLIATSAPAAFAQPDWKPDCADPFTQAAINTCARIDQEAADAEMTVVYQQVIAQYRQQDRDVADLGPEYVGAEMLLAASQDGWRDSRSDFCGARGVTNYGGSMRPAVVAGCFAMLARSRTEELRWLLD